MKESEDKIKRKWKYKRIRAFAYCLIAMASVFVLLDGMLYSVCNTAATYVGINGGYLFLAVGILHMILVLISDVYFWYTHVQCMRHGVSDRIEL